MTVSLRIDHSSDVPPFEQVRSRLATQVVEGELPAGTRLPTVRALAEQLGLAVNTVAKAYRALEADGVIETRGRAGTFVASGATAQLPAEVERLAREYVAAARRAGLTAPEATELVRRGWASA